MRIFLIVALLFLSTPAYAQEQEPECGALQVMIKKLMAEENLAYLSDAIDLSGTVHMWYVSAKTGRWVQLTVTDVLEACISNRGYDWHFAMDR